MATKNGIIALLLLAIGFIINANGAPIPDSLQKTDNNTASGISKIELLLRTAKAEEGINNENTVLFATKAYHIAKAEGLVQYQLQSLILMARGSLSLNNFISCVQMAEEGIMLAQRHKLRKEEAIMKGILGVVYAETGNSDKSAQYYFDALSIFEEIGDKTEVGLTLGNLGADFLNQKSYDKALQYMNRALEIANEMGDKQGVAQQYNNMAGVFMSKPDSYNLALTYFKKALMVNNEISDNYQAAINMANMGIVYERMNISDSALLYFTQSLEVFTQMNHALRKAEVMIHLSRFFEARDKSKSHKFALDAFRLGQKHQSLNTINNAATILHKYYLGTGDTIQAYHYSKAQHDASDSLFQLQNKKAMFLLEFNYNQERIDKERKLSQQRRSFAFILVIIGLLTGLVISVLFYSRQKIKTKNVILVKEKTESMLRFKNKELSINLMALLKKNEILEEISAKLSKIEKEGDKTEIRNSVAALNQELKINIDNRIWKEFSTRFNETNYEFYEKLSKKHPGLTQNELRLCAYLRLNMTTKDISDLTGQRTETIEVARYRLRKKLGIANSDSNLVGFLSQI